MMTPEDRPRLAPPTITMSTIAATVAPRAGRLAPNRSSEPFGGGCTADEVTEGSAEDHRDADLDGRVTE